MNLESLQTNLHGLIKFNEIPLEMTNDYLREIQSSKNLRLIKKITLWWRTIQIEQFCRLTAGLLKTRGEFDLQLSNFISEKDFSSFRDEIGLQFLDYIIYKKLDSLLQSVAEFELSIIQLKKGEPVQCCISWQFEPYSVIQGLLNDTLEMETLKKGNYEVSISYMNSAELFNVIDKDLI